MDKIEDQGQIEGSLMIRITVDLNAEAGLKKDRKRIEDRWCNI